MEPLHRRPQSYAVCRTICNGVSKIGSQTFWIPMGHPAHIQALDVFHLAVVTLQIAGEQKFRAETATSKPPSSVVRSRSNLPSMQENCTMRWSRLESAENTEPSPQRIDPGTVCRLQRKSTQVKYKGCVLFVGGAPSLMPYTETEDSHGLGQAGALFNDDGKPTVDNFGRGRRARCSRDCDCQCTAESLRSNGSLFRLVPDPFLLNGGG